MKITLNKPQEYEVNRIQVRAKVRYWEDSEVNGLEDEKGDLIPCRQGENWCPIIDVDSGKILNWEIGKTADIHYKVCDEFECDFVDENYNTIKSYDGYVPEFMCPKESGEGDYIIMDINEDGLIKDWNIDAVKNAIEIEED